jgi:hypothetical protein
MPAENRNLSSGFALVLDYENAGRQASTPRAGRESVRSSRVHIGISPWYRGRALRLAAGPGQWNLLNSKESASVR